MSLDNYVSEFKDTENTVQQAESEKLRVLVQDSKYQLQRRGFQYELKGGSPSEKQLQELYSRVQNEEVESQKYIKLGLVALREIDFELTFEDLDLGLALPPGTWAEWECLDNNIIPSDLEIDAIAIRLRVQEPIILAYPQDELEPTSGHPEPDPVRHVVEIPHRPAEADLRRLSLTATEFKELREALGIDRDIMGVLAGSQAANPASVIEAWETDSESKRGQSSPNLSACIILRILAGQLPELRRMLAIKNCAFLVGTRHKDIAEYHRGVMKLAETANALHEQQIALAAKMRENAKASEDIQTLAKEAASQFMGIIDRHKNTTEH